ncbi:MAG: heavy-metal-associated domain-containing protein [Fimbriimonadales bacterium]
MTCQDCSRRIAEALAKIPGVAEACVDCLRGRAQVDIAEDIPAAHLISAVRDAGYEASRACVTGSMSYSKKISGDGGAG